MTKRSLPGFFAEKSLYVDSGYHHERQYLNDQNERITPSIKPVDVCWISFAARLPFCGLSGPAATACIIAAGIVLLACVDATTRGL